MTKTTTITINGRLYNAVTGLPVAAATTQQETPKAARPAHHAPKPATLRAFSDIGPRPTVAPSVARPTQVAPTPKAARAQHPAAQAVHARPQKSQTLYRKALKKPVVEAVAHADNPTHQRSPLISKFGSNLSVHPDLTQPNTESAEAHIAPPQVHPKVAKIIQRAAPVTPQTSSELKEQLIKERLAEVSDTPQKPHKRAWFKSKPRLATILTSSLALLVLGGYLTYMNLPVISMKVAATRAGVNATFPNYRPDGYGLNGPITYSPGEVNINYKSTTNDAGFKITQKPSNWDSQGLLDNYVTRQTENYLTFQERGVTVYTFGNKAAWVNGGLLYTLDGNASLSSDQVLRLATSM